MSSALCERESAHRGHDKGHSVCLFVAIVLQLILLLLLVVLFFFVEQKKDAIGIFEGNCCVSATFTSNLK